MKDTGTKIKWVVATSLMSGTLTGMSQLPQNVKTATSNTQPQAAGTSTFPNRSDETLRFIDPARPQRWTLTSHG